jgi:hypothetical protein
MVNCIFTDNVASYGGGMYNWDSNPLITNCTLTRNAGALAGGGVVSEGTATPVILNSILWDNTNGEIIGSTVADVTYSDIEGGYSGATNINSDPLFQTGSVQLQSGSPCVDTGTATGAPAEDYAQTPRPQGEGHDMGAYEYQAIIGDVNSEDGVNLLDATLINLIVLMGEDDLNAYLTLQKMNTVREVLGNVNKDTSVNLLDATLVNLYILMGKDTLNDYLTSQGMDIVYIGEPYEEP